LVDFLSVSDIKLNVLEFGASALQTAAIFRRIALRTEEIGPHVVIDSGHRKAEFIEKRDGFGPD
jgi:hypothetical protein